MVWSLTRKEILDQILSIRFSIALILALACLIPGTYALATHYGWLHREMGPLINEGFYNPWNRIWYWLNRDLPALYVLATGLDADLSLRSGNTVISGPNFGESQFVHNFLDDLFSHLDFVFFVNTVCSLLVFVFMYDAISGERHGGTLRQTLTNPISRPIFLVSKFLGRFLSFVIALVPAMTGVVIVLYLHPDVAFRESDWVATGFLFLLALLYLCAFAMLGLFVSCVTKEPKTSLTALLMIWILLVLVVPNFAPLLAAKLRPVRSVHEIEAQVAALRKNFSEPLKEEIKHFKQKHGADWKMWSESESDSFDLIQYKYRHKLKTLSADVIMKIRGEFLNEVEAQANVSQFLSSLSPSAALTYLASDIASTGLESERDFRRAVIRYRRQYAEYLDRYIDKTGDYSRLIEIDTDHVPPFEYKALRFSQVIGVHFHQFMIIVLYTPLFYLAAQIAFVRSQI